MSIYKNVMELLVEEEVARRYRALPARVATYVNQIEWVAHALNQLPPLYATSEKGLQHQLQQGRSKYKMEISQAVQRAFAAIRRDPLRSSTPLRSPQAPFREVLSQLRFLLRNEQLEWETLPSAVEQALAQANQAKPNSQPVRTPAVYAPVKGSSPFPTHAVRPTADPLTPPATRRNAQIAQPNKNNDEFGWDDPLYNPR